MGTSLQENSVSSGFFPRQFKITAIGQALYFYLFLFVRKADKGDIDYVKGLHSWLVCKNIIGKLDQEE